MKSGHDIIGRVLLRDVLQRCLVNHFERSTRNMNNIK